MFLDPGLRPITLFRGGCGFIIYFYFFFADGASTQKGGVDCDRVNKDGVWAGRMHLFSSINSAMSSGLRNDLMF